VSPSTTGFEANRPAKLGGAVKRNRQRGRSAATLSESIVAPDAARVPSRSRFGSGQLLSASSVPPQAVTTADSAAATTTAARQCPDLSRS
jgi:hypothetical protein